MNVYESERLLNEYLLFHYGALPDILPWDFGPRDSIGFPVHCVRECLDVAMLPEQARALDLGCAVGRSSFELARFCTEVIGIDMSQAFIRAAAHLKRAGHLGFDRVEEGTVTTRCMAEVPHNVDRSRVHFEVGDAMRLRSSLGDFDVVFVANLLCRLEDPAMLLAKLPHLVRSHGQLIITSPYTWTREFTPSAKWLGGYEREGEQFDSFTAIQQILAPHFRLLRTRDLPFLIREHARKYQWSVAHASIWLREG